MSNSFKIQGRFGLPLAALTCLLGAWTVSAAGPAQEPAPDRAATEPVVQDKEEHTPLQLGMKNLNRGMKAMRPMLKDFEGNQATIIKTLETMESSLLEAFAQTPPRPEGEMTDSQWAQYKIGYRQKLNGAMGVLLEMELAAHKGDAAAVIQNYRNLGRHKKDGHGSYKLD